MEKVLSFPFNLKSEERYTVSDVSVGVVSLVSRSWVSKNSAVLLL